MSQPELLKHVITALAAAGVEYMVTGSVASSLQGEPRASHDIDLVIEMRHEAVSQFSTLFPPPDFYLSEDAMRDAVRHRSMFNLLRIADGEKVDFWLLTNEPFDRSRFARRRVEQAFGISLNVSAPEDTILAKLRWAKLSGGSEKQFTDALRVYEVQGTTLDLEYLAHWSAELGVGDLWEHLRTEARPIQDVPPAPKSEQA